MIKGKVLFSLFAAAILMSTGLPAQVQFTQIDEYGLVVFEAEDFAEQIIPDAALWEVIDVAGEASNDQAIQSATGAPFAEASDALQGSGMLSYYIEFIKSDTVFLWYRGFHMDGGDDSFHAGIDGDIPVGLLDRLAFTGEEHAGNWTWQSWRMDKARPRVYVDAGIHEFHIFQRERDLMIDKFVLTTDREYDPELYTGDLFGPDVTPATGINDARNMQNKNFSLAQNYPNPFNPSTSIGYELFEAGQIRLSIYNTAGQEMEVLVDAFQNTGTYNVNWNAANLANGVYFYKLESANFSQTKKLLLQK